MKELRMYRQSLLARYRQAGEELDSLVSSLSSEERQAPLHSSRGERAENSLERSLYVLFRDHAGSAEQVIGRVHAEEFQVNFPQIQKLSARQLDFSQPVIARQDGDSRANPMETRLEEILRARRQVSAWLDELPPEAWGKANRYQSTGVRTLQWWVERSLGVVEAALKILKTGIKERA